MVNQDAPVICRENLEKIVDVAKNPMPFSDVIKSLQTHKNSRPEGFAIDPRNGNLIVYCKSRSRRPDVYGGRDSCSVCVGEIPTPIRANKLPSGNYAFLTENRFSFLNPDLSLFDLFREWGDLRGINFLLWPTTEHKEIHEISYEDNAVSFQLMGDIERSINEATQFPNVHFVKYTGSSETNSHMHAQYHVAGIKIGSRRLRDEVVRLKKFHEDIKFRRKRGKTFPEYTIQSYQQNMPGLVIRDYGSATLAVHPRMRRPLEAIIYPNDTTRSCVSDLNEEERMDMAKATSDVSYALSLLMPAMHKQFDYKFVFHNNGGTFYIEVFPSSQRQGGFESSNIYVCESTPGECSGIYRRFFNIMLPREDILRVENSPFIELYIRREIEKIID